jgi:hypothetical protein
MNTPMDPVAESVRQILQTIPAEVTLVAAAKTRTLQEVQAAIEAGVKHIGYNYVQEALPIIQEIGDRVTWHMIGHLQRNKAKVVVQNFDMVETVDSWQLAQALDRHCANVGKKISVLVEVNSGQESNKTGVLPGDVDELVNRMKELEHDNGTAFWRSRAEQVLLQSDPHGFRAPCSQGSAECDNAIPIDGYEQQLSDCNRRGCKYRAYWNETFWGEVVKEECQSKSQVTFGSVFSRKVGQSMGVD